MLAVGGFAFAGKLAGAAKEIAVAWRFGVSPTVDAYLFVFNLVSWSVAVWIGVLTIVLIPVAARLRGNSREFALFRRELLGATIAVGFALSALSFFLLPALVKSPLIGLPSATATLAASMAPALSWLILAGALIALYSAWMMSRASHVNTLLEGLPALGILCGVLVSGMPAALVWGTIGGTVVQLWLVASASRHDRRYDWPAFSLSSPTWVEFGRALGVLALGQAVMSFTTVIDQLFAARLGEGAISEMGYANRILALLMGIVATAITRGTLPVFSQSHSQGRQDLRPIAMRWSGLMVVVGVLTCVVMWFAAPVAVHLLYQRGTFSATDAASVTRLLRFGIAQLPFYFGSLVLVSLHSALGRYRLIVASSVFAIVVKTVSTLLLLKHFGVAALMISPAFMYLANAGLFVWYDGKKVSLSRSP
jgi:peptidoglycan biosynthesis protein MviN/MurJ (putative lipid II flippase)